MKTIIKLGEPQMFAKWKEAHPQATYNDLTQHAQVVKQQLMDALLNEQRGLCCYCEQTVHSNSAHIEHFKPKGNPAYAHLQLDYDNLLACCINKPEKNYPQTCGVSKGNKYSTDLIAPTEPDCASHFAYRADGSIYEATPGDRRATYTIRLLNLNHPHLRQMRQRAIQNLLEPSLTPDELNALKEDYLRPLSDGKLKPFPSIVEYLF